MKKRFLTVILPAALAGLFIGIAGRWLKIPPKTFLTYYFIAGAVFIAALVILQFLLLKHYQKKIRAACDLLEGGEPQAALDRFRSLYEGARGAYLKTLLALDVCAAYCDLKQYDRALEILQRDEKHCLKGLLKPLYFMNLCFCYFYLGREEEALALYGRYEKDLHALSFHREFEANTSILSVYVSVARGETDLARPKLELAKQIWQSPRFQEDYRRLEALIHEA